MPPKDWESNDDDGDPADHDVGQEWAEESWQGETIDDEEAVDILLESLGPEDAYLKLPTVERAYRYHPPSLKWKGRYN